MRPLTPYAEWHTSFLIWRLSNIIFGSICSFFSDFTKMSTIIKTCAHVSNVSRARMQEYIKALLPIVYWFFWHIFLALILNTCLRGVWNYCLLRRLERVFRCYIVCEAKEDYKEGCLMVWANYMSPCNSIVGLYFKGTCDVISVTIATHKVHKSVL